MAVRKLGWFIQGAGALALVACLGQDDKDAGLTMAITDAPIDGASAVVVQVNALVIKPAEGSARTIEFHPARSFNLLGLAGGDTELLLDSEKVPAGAYTSAELKLNAAADGVMDSYITLADGSKHELVLPDGQAARANGTYVVPETGGVRYTIDFDLRKSVTGADGDGNYVLEPSLRLVQDSAAGSIAGSVGGILMGGACTPAVYVFSGSDVTPDDIDGSSPDPVASGAVSSSGDFRVAFLPAGDYTVAYTCEAAQDNPVSSEDMGFIAQNATVSPGESTEILFTPSGGADQPTGTGGGAGGGTATDGDDHEDEDEND